MVAEVFHYFTRVVVSGVDGKKFDDERELLGVASDLKKMQDLI